MVSYCILYNMVSYCTIWYHIVQYGTILYNMVSYCTIWYHIVQYGIILYNMISYCTIWYHIILYYINIILYYISPLLSADAGCYICPCKAHPPAKIMVFYIIVHYFTDKSIKCTFWPGFLPLQGTPTGKNNG